MPLVPLSPIDHVFTGRGAYPIEFVFAYGGAIDAGAPRGEPPPRASRPFRPSRAGSSASPATASPSSRTRGAARSASPSRRPTTPTPNAGRVFLDPVDGREGEPLGRVLLTRTPDGLRPRRQPLPRRRRRLQLLLLPLELGAPLPGRAVPAAVARPRGALPGGRRGRRRGRRATVLDAGGLFRAGPRPEVDRDHIRLAPARPLPRRARGDAPGGPGREPGPPLAQRHGRRLALEEVPRRVGRATTRRSTRTSAARSTSEAPPGRRGRPTSATPSPSRRRRSRAGSSPTPRSATSRRASGAPSTPSTRRRRSASLLALERLRRAEGLAAMEECHVVHPRQGLLLTNLSAPPGPRGRLRRRPARRVRHPDAGRARRRRAPGAGRRDRPPRLPAGARERRRPGARRR